MDFTLTEEQQGLKGAARSWLAGKFPLDRDWENQNDRWSQLEELGWTDVAAADLGFVEEALLLEELGYALYPGPFLQHVTGLSDDGATTVDATRPLATPPEESPKLRAAMAAEAVGIAQRALDLGIEHASTREQFGKPIGTYQAVSHPLDRKSVV